MNDEIDKPTEDPVASLVERLRVLPPDARVLLDCGGPLYVGYVVSVIDDEAVVLRGEMQAPDAFGYSPPVVNDWLVRIDAIEFVVRKR